jgi:hypothetical protein
MLIKQRSRLSDLKPPKSFKFVYVWGKGLGFFADKKFKKGDKLRPLVGKKVNISVATPEAIQISKDEFIDTKYLVPEDFINHSCSPNAMADVVKRQFTAIKDIAKNDEITFNYNTTEYDMKRYGGDFDCVCGAKNCLGNIKGFKYLTNSQKSKLKSRLTPFLLDKLEK